MLGFDSDESSTQLESAVAIMSSGLDRISWNEFRAAFLPPVDPFAEYLRDYETYLRALFERADANSDGDLSYSELVAALNDPDFAEVAVDAMGFVESGITREEFAAQFLEVCDWNEDYKVQWEEFREAALASALTAMHEGRMEAALRDVFDRVQGGDGTITIDDAVQGLRDDPDFAEVLGFFATHQANEFDGSLEYLIDKLVAMDTNQDGVIEWSEFRAVVFPPPPSEMDIYMQNYENYLRAVFERIDEDQSGSLSTGNRRSAARRRRRRRPRFIGKRSYLNRVFGSAVASLDWDGDCEITRDEFPDGTRDRCRGLREDAARDPPEACVRARR